MIHIFIINPVAGLRDRSEGIRQFLERKTDFSYLVFDTEKPEDERDIVARMLKLFDDEKIRFYICGGSGTFVNALNGIEEKDLPRVEMAHYPCGLTNDFLKNAGRNQRFFYNMDNLIRGDVAQVDYIRNIAAEGEQTHNHVLFSATGLTERVERFATRFKFLGGINSGFLYAVSFLCTFLFNPTVSFAIEIDGEDYSGEYDMIYIGNSICMGGSFYPVSDASVEDGQMDVMLLKKIRKWHSIHFMSLFRHGKLDQMSEEQIVLKKAVSVSVKRKDGKLIYLNMDGEIVISQDWKVELAPSALNYVVPKGTKFGQWI